MRELVVVVGDLPEREGCALLSTGKVDCWGLNVFGQLGDGTTTGPDTCSFLPSEPCSPTPVRVGGITNATQLSAGDGVACALLAGGHVDCWGDNGAGELGDGTTTASSVAVQVSGIP